MNAVNAVQTQEELICRAVARYYRLGRNEAGHSPRTGLMSTYVDPVTHKVVLVTLDGKTVRYDVDSFR